MICHVDCSGIRDAKQLHSCLARFLNLPEWYGHNLDALFDCLTELPSPTQLFLHRWNSAAPWAPGFEAVLTDAGKACPDLTVVFD